MSTRINAVRKAIGDSGTEQRLIKTLPRKGVRFVGEVREGQEPARAPETVGTRSSRPTTRTWQWRLPAPQAPGTETLNGHSQTLTAVVPARRAASRRCSAGDRGGDRRHRPYLFRGSVVGLFRAFGAGRTDQSERRNGVKASADCREN